MTSPKAAYLAQKRDIDAAIRKVLDGGRFILGKEVASFERAFARFLGAAAAVGVGSGTDALELGLRSLGIGPGDAVATVALTATATVAAIELAGATPVLVDVDPETLTMDPARLDAAAKALRLKAAIPVHLYGRACDMPKVMAVAQRRGLKVLEDCAQSHGAKAAGKTTGSWGHAAAFSFYPTKNLGALGDGGALVTNDSALARKARALREYGWGKRHVSDAPGMNSRLDELQAAVLRVKLRGLRRENARRRGVAGFYGTALDGLPLRLPRPSPGLSHVFHQYVVRSDRRDALRAFLRKNGVETQVLYPVPIHLQPAYRDRLRAGPGGLGQSEQACRELLCLPLSKPEAERAASLCRRFFER